MTAATAPFGRVLTAMVTAFDDDGTVDLDGTAAIAKHLVDNGNDGLVVSGTTGEAPTTTTTEDGQILRTVLEAVGDRATVIAGVGTNNTAHSIELIEQAEKLGAHGALLVTPYYNKPTQDGITAHFRAVAGASGLPIMLYDIPGRTGVAIAPDTFKRVAEDSRFVAVKDAVGDIYRGVQIMSQTGLTFYSGDDALNLAWLTHGAVGVVSVVGHVTGPEHADMIAAIDRGDLTAALDIYRSLVPVIDVMMNRVQGAMTAKAAMQLLGVLPSRTMRLPLVPADDEIVAALRAELVALGRDVR
ncbi:MAG: 4-hydroxy-tetrahydrodipicolinate synthase [Nocardioidaceae bacterium]|nr:MAG: 4-hydroxy-tetrahydrodipicolinate synthase [Nocardioidaceae bacterium]